MRQHSKEGRFLIGVISPTFASGAPEFEIVSQPGSGDEGQDGGTVIGGSNDEKRNQQKREQGIRFVECGRNKIEHEGEEGSEQKPINSFRIHHKGTKSMKFF